MNNKKNIYIFNKTSKAARYGIGTYLNQMINCFIRANIEFDVIFLYAEGTEIQIDNKEYYRKISIPIVNYTNQINEKKYLTSVVYLLHNFIPINDNQKLIFHFNFTTTGFFIEKLKEIFNCKILIAIHYSNWNLFLSGNYNKLLKILNAKNIKNELDKTIKEQFEKDAITINKCDKIICVAKHTLKPYLKLKKIDEKKAIIINPGLPDLFNKNSESCYQIKKNFFINKKTRIILFVGRIDPNKGILYLIRSFKEVLKKYPDTILIIVGDGNFSDCMNEAKSCWTKIIFTGRLEPYQLYEFYKIADIGVIPSIFEEFGYVAIEMMMHKLPIISSNTGGLSEIIQNNISGIKIEVLNQKYNRSIDTNILTQKILHLIENPEESRRLGTNARKRFLRKYEIKVFENKLLALFNNL